MSGYVHLDGELVEQSAARVSVFDRGFRYGDGVFETLRAYGGHVFAWDAHMARLDRSCAALDLAHGIDHAELYERVTSTLSANELADAYVRVSITRGVQGGRLEPQAEVDPTVVIVTESMPRGGIHGASTWDDPAAVVLSDVQRVPDAAIPAGAKTHNFLNGILARVESRDAGADEAILRDGRGALTEGTVSNLFLVRNGELATPNPDVGPLLPGITRARVLSLAADQDVAARETVLYPRDLRNADEAFLTNTTWEIRPIGAVEGTSIARGPVTDRLIEAFDRMIEEHCYRPSAPSSA